MRTKQKKPAKVASSPNRVWNDDYFLRSYELAAQGFTDPRIAEALGVSRVRFARWVSERPALQRALASARQSVTGPPGGEWNGCGERFLDYCYKRLPPELKELWDKIQGYNGIHPTKGTYNRKREDPDAYNKIMALFERPGMERARQSLFIHAIVASNFNANEACRKVCITHNKVLAWCQQDPKFKELVDQLDHMKGAFAEAAAFRGVASGDGALIRMVLQAYMPERYNPKVIHHHEGEIALLHGTTEVEKVLGQMPLEERRKILDSMRSAATKALGPHLPQGIVIDAEEVIENEGI